jgi:hypothetical protein
MSGIPPGELGDSGTFSDIARGWRGWQVFGNSGTDGTFSDIGGWPGLSALLT